MERRLTAILAADVVGFGRLMEADEAGTLAALKARRKTILEPLLAKHHGRLVKLMGDGVLAEFASAVNAVACAVELQSRMAAANGDAAPERATSMAMGSTSPRGWRRWPSPAASMLPAPCSTMSGTRSICASRISASRR
jgi:class 3 adenylate cyclase